MRRIYRQLRAIKKSIAAKSPAAHIATIGRSTSTGTPRDILRARGNRGLFASRSKSPKSCASKTKPKSNPSYCSTIFRANSTRSDIKTSSNSSINSRGKSSSRRRRNHTSTSTASGDYFTFKTESCSVNLNRYHRYHRPLSHCRQRAMISHSKRSLVR